METTQLPDRPQQPLHEYLRTHARERGDRPACIWYGHSFSYAELDAASDAFADRLQAIGVRKGDPVVLFLNNCPQYLAAPTASRRSAIVCPKRPAQQGARTGLPGQRPEGTRDRRGLVADAGGRQGPRAFARTRVHRALRRPAAGDSNIDVPADLAAARREPRSVPPGCEDFLAVMKSGQRRRP